MSKIKVDSKWSKGHPFLNVKKDTLINKIIGREIGIDIMKLAIARETDEEVAKYMNMHMGDNQKRISELRQELEKERAIIKETHG